MANGLNVTVEIKEGLQNSDAAVVLLHKWPEKGTPKVERSIYSKELKDLAAAGLITGDLGSTTVHLLAGSTPSRLIVISLGESEKVSADAYRAAGGALAKWIGDHPLRSVAVLEAADPAALVAGFILGGFDYTDYKGTLKSAKPQAAVKLRMTGKYSADQRAEIERAVTIAQAQNYARTIANRPANDINPVSLAKVAEELAKEVGLGIKILDEKKMKQLGMGGMLGVGGGSTVTPPRMIVLNYCPPHPKYRGSPEKVEKLLTEKFGPTLLVIGKAITFDTGGISIKGAAGMNKMVFDKCGAMAVLGMMRAVARLKLPVRIVGILASAENHISDTAYRPGDILKMYNGVTVEVISTDAEGRLVLGDALAWGIETYKPAAVVNLATLTGGVVIALGKTMAGLMTNNDAIAGQLEAASKLAGEKVWRLPIGEDQRKLLKAGPADIMNSGPREGSPLIGGAFLSFFVPGNMPWAHIDIAGVANTDTDLPYYTKGATGWGVRTMVEWVTARAGKNS